MLLEQNGCHCRIIISLISILSMIVVCSSNPIHERIRRDDDKDNCKVAGNHHHQTFCYGFRVDVDRREGDVQQCFDKLYRSYKWNRDISYLSINEGSCRCTVKASSKWKWEETFKKARENINQRCCGFAYNVMGCYENDMRLLAMCH